MGMGCSSSLGTNGFNMETGSMVSGDLLVGNQPVYQLTLQQKQLVRNTWRIIAKDMDGAGKRVFLCIFDIDPSLKQLFPFRDQWGDALTSHPLFKEHSMRFMRTVGKVVANLDGLFEHRVMLKNLGKTHIRHENFKAENFGIFKKAILIVWRKQLAISATNGNEIMDAWTPIFEYILLNLKDGYEAAALEQEIKNYYTID